MQLSNRWIDNGKYPCAYLAKSKLVAFLLSFFMGGLGIDWFYLSVGSASYIVGGIVKIIFVFILPGCGQALTEQLSVVVAASALRLAFSGALLTGSGLQLAHSMMVMVWNYTKICELKKNRYSSLQYFYHFLSHDDNRYI